MTCLPLSAPPLGDRMDAKYALGRRVVGWVETCCVFGEGDRLGQPVKLEQFQVDFLLLLFELAPDGRRRYRRALLEMPKGDGKSPISAWVGAYELTHRDSASIPVAAASYEQAEVLFGDLRTCIRESPLLAAEVEAFEHEVVRIDGRGRAFKVAAVAGTNDGGRPTAFLADEVHEWVGNKERVHLVLSNGCAKRSGSLVLNTTTPGFDADSLAGRLHDHGLQVNSGEVDDPGFLFVWYGCPDDRFDLDDPAGLRDAIRAANPAADRFLDVETVAARFAQVPRHEFLRYHLGLWTTTGESWLPAGAWADCEDPGRPHGRIADRSEVTLGFDGSFNNDSTALVACTVEATPHVDVVEAWERPALARHDWAVPIIDVEEAIRVACRRWQVREIVCDPFRWARSYQVLEAEGLPIVEFPQSPQRMTPATQRFYEAVVNGAVSHSGDPRLARHLANTVLKVDARGSRLAKETRNSGRKIDLAVAAVMAFERAAQRPVAAAAPRFLSWADLAKEYG